MNSLIDWITRIVQSLRPWITVLPWELAVRVRAGRWVKQVGPGMHVKLPIIDEFVVVNTRLRIASTAAQTISTLDRVPVTVAAYVGFRITDPLRAMLRLQSPEISCSAFAATCIAEYVTSHRADEISIRDLEAATTEKLKSFSQDGFEFEFVAVVDYAAVKTFRLLNEQGRSGVWGDGAPTNVGGSQRF